MANTAVEIIRDGADRITTAMLGGRFSIDDLQTIKQIFEEGVKATDTCIARGLKIEKVSEGTA